MPSKWKILFSRVPPQWLHKENKQNGRRRSSHGEGRDQTARPVGEGGNRGESWKASPLLTTLTGRAEERSQRRQERSPLKTIGLGYHSKNSTPKAILSYFKAATVKSRGKYSLNRGGGVFNTISL